MHILTWIHYRTNSAKHAKGKLNFEDRVGLCGRACQIVESNRIHIRYMFNKHACVYTIHSWSKVYKEG